MGTNPEGLSPGYRSALYTWTSTGDVAVMYCAAQAPSDNPQEEFTPDRLAVRVKLERKEI
jgi:hypothetical protein